MPRKFPPVRKSRQTRRKLAALYIRMSTDQQEDSPERQEHDLREYCRKEGYQVVGVYCDKALTGINSAANRGEYQACLRDAQEGKFEYLICWEQSRLTRSMGRKVVVELDPFADAGIKFVWTDKGVRNLDDLADLLMTMLDGHSNNEYVRKVVRASLAGRAKNAREGKWTSGKVPYFLRIDADKKLHLHPDADRLAMGRQMLDWYLEGKSDRTIRMLLEEEYGLKFGQSFVQKTLTDPFYVGDYVWPRRNKAKMFAYVGGQIVDVEKGTRDDSFRNGKSDQEDQVYLPNNHAALFDREKWLKALQLRKTNSKATTPIPRTAHNPHFLRQICFCAHCGGAMSCCKKPNRMVVVCDGYRHGACKQFVLDAHEVLNYIVATLADLVTPEHIQACRDKLAADAKKSAKQVNVGELRKQLRSLEKKLDTKTEQAFESDNPARFDALLGKLESQIAVLKERIETATVPVNDQLERLESQAAAVSEAVGNLQWSVANCLEEDPQLVNATLKTLVARAEIRTGEHTDRYHGKYYFDQGIVELTPSANMLAPHSKCNQVRICKPAA